MTFAHESVRDKYSILKDTIDYCGVLTPNKFSCATFSQERAYLDATSGDATINLNWDSTLINTTLSCNFEYYSTDYDTNWVGDSFDVVINDPCLGFADFIFIVTTSTGDSEFDYIWEQEALSFTVSFTSSIDEESG